MAAAGAVRATACARTVADAMRPMGRETDMTSKPSAIEWQCRGMLAAGSLLALMAGPAAGQTGSDSQTVLPTLLRD